MCVCVWSDRRKRFGFVIERFASTFKSTRDRTNKYKVTIFHLMFASTKNSRKCDTKLNLSWIKIPLRIRYTWISVSIATAILQTKEFVILACFFFQMVACCKHRVNALQNQQKKKCVSIRSYAPISRTLATRKCLYVYQIWNSLSSHFDHVVFFVCCFCYSSLCVSKKGDRSFNLFQTHTLIYNKIA